MLQIVDTKVGSIVTVDLKGRLDWNTSDQLQQLLDRLIDRGEIQFVIDLALLDYISSAGLGVLAAVAKRSKAAGGELFVCGATGVVKRVFEVSGFSAAVPMVANKQEAMERYKG